MEKEVTKGSVVSRKSYVYNNDDILLEYNTSGQSPYESARYIGTGEIDDNLMVIRGEKAFFYHKDHLGSIISITNEVGEIVQKNHYSSFGKIVSIKNKDRVSLSFDSALDQPFYYTGREWDSELDMYYYRARHYDPSTGRFLTVDPKGLAAGDTNFYRYVGNNPIKYNDPTGMDKELIRDPEGWTHDVLRIYDPAMPGNDFYVDLTPTVDVNIWNVNSEVGGYVDITQTRPTGNVLAGSYQKMSTEETSALFQRALDAEQDALKGNLKYKFLDFNLNDNTNPRSTNCRGFVNGL